jgi:hypothetical protein
MISLDEDDPVAGRLEGCSRVPDRDGVVMGAAIAVVEEVCGTPEVVGLEPVEGGGNDVEAEPERPGAMATSGGD